MIPSDFKRVYEASRSSSVSNRYAQWATPSDRGSRGVAPGSLRMNTRWCSSSYVRNEPMSPSNIGLALSTVLYQWFISANRADFTTM